MPYYRLDNLTAIAGKAIRVSRVASSRNSPLRLAPQASLESAEYAARQIRDAIVAGKLRPGDRLIEMELAKQLKISRHPIRESLRVLSREGLVSMRRNRGAVVAEVDAKSILEVYELRSVLGSLALRHLLLSGDGPSLKQLAKLEQLAQKAYSFAAKNLQEPMARHDLEFQASIVEASGLDRLAPYFRDLGIEILRFINLLKINYPNKKETAKREVLGLFEAIRDRDIFRAEQIWHGKFVVAAQRLVSMIPGGEELARDRRWLLTGIEPPSTDSVPR